VLGAADGRAIGALAPRYWTHTLTELPMTEPLPLRARVVRSCVLALMIGIALAGSLAIAWAGSELVGAGIQLENAAFAGVLLTMSLITVLFPMRVAGAQGTVISIETVPQLVIVVTLPTHEAVLAGCIVAAVAAFPAMSHGNLRRQWLNWTYAVTVNALIPGVVSVFAASLFGGALHGQIDLGHALLVGGALTFGNWLGYTLLGLFNEPTEIKATLLSDLQLTVADGLGASIALTLISPYLDSVVPATIILTLIGAVVYGAVWISNSRNNELRRNAHLRDTFSRYVPEGIVSNNPDVFERVELGGEQREISVLFCDIRGFTSWSEQHEATEVIRELNVLLGALSDAVMGEQGTLDKFTGDGLMAFWGAPFEQPDHAERACRAALDMLQRLDHVNLRRTEAGQEPFAIGVGVHSGNAVVGNVGHDKRLDYTAIGDTVNLAARLEAATKELGSVMLVSAATVYCLDVEMRDRAMRIGDITVKGRRQPVEVWALQPKMPDFDAGEDLLAA
jgi:class 3 adenylate cyclase